MTSKRSRETVAQAVVRGHRVIRGPRVKSRFLRNRPGDADRPGIFVVSSVTSSWLPGIIKPFIKAVKQAAYTRVFPGSGHRAVYDSMPANRSQGRPSAC